MAAITPSVGTAADLFTLIGPFDPTVEDGELVLALDPSPDVVAALGVLHTGVRALLTRNRWWGSASDKPRVVELNPAAPVPPGITLLCVDGDRRWDRIHPAARVDLPRLFAPDRTRNLRR